jgi:hypothetical protein
MRFAITPLPKSTLTDAAMLDKGCTAGMIAARNAPGSVTDG